MARRHSSYDGARAVCQEPTALGRGPLTFRNRSNTCTAVAAPARPGLTAWITFVHSWSR